MNIDDCCKSLNKKYIWSFMGQVKGKPTRENMLAKLKNIPGEKFVHITEEWNDKNQIKISEYKQILKDSVFVPCPSGWGGAIGLKDCFRLYETLEAESIPIIEKDDYKYFDSFFPGHPLIQVSSSWDEIEDVINEWLKDKDKLEAYNEKLIKWWSDYKSNLKLKIRSSLFDAQFNNVTLSRDSDVKNKLKLKQQEFIDLKGQWLNFFNNDRFGKHRKLFDWVKYISSQIPAIEELKDRFNCFNPFKKIAIVSLYTKEISEFAVYSEKSIKDYCEKQGYSFYVYRENLDKNGSPNWSKSQALLNHIDDHDYIVWMDSDTLIFNPEKKLESIIEKAPKKFILATKDIGDHCMLNSGVLFFKSHQYTKNLITKWRDFDGDKSSLYASGGDQEIFCQILKKSDAAGFNRKIFEMNEFNTDPRLVNEDTFILHFMAYPHELKKIFMSYWNQLEF